MIQKESRESEKEAFPCHVVPAVIVGGSKGKMVTALLIFFIRLCICKLRGNSLYTIERVFDNFEDQTGRKRAERISAEGRAVSSGPCQRGMVSAFPATLAPALLTSPLQLPLLCQRWPPAWGNHGLMLRSSGDQIRRMHFCGVA